MREEGGFHAIIHSSGWSSSMLTVERLWKLWRHGLQF